MNFQLIPPPPLLKDYVKSFWFCEGESLYEQPFLYHAMADGLPELVFQYKGSFTQQSIDGKHKLPAAFVFGQASMFTQKECHGHFGMMGVYLYPFALPILFGLPASELNNLIIDFKTLLPNQGKELESRILEAVSNEHRIELISQFLISRLCNIVLDDKATPAAISYIMRNKGQTDIDTLASTFNTSPRQFERKFRIHSGFSPKLFSRIIRFQAALNEFGNTQKSLTEIAYECCYYDQSHFIHDFKKFSGLHPKLYFNGKAPGTELRSLV